MRRSIAARVSVCSALAIIALAPLGCTTAQQFRMNPSPNISNLEWSSNEIDNQLTITNDTNFRAFSNDLGRALLLDKPSELTLIPAMPYSHQ